MSRPEPAEGVVKVPPTDWSAPWRAAAACADLPMDWFFPDRGDRPHRALAACAGCPVRVECLAAAEAEELHDRPDCTFGIRGGRTATERRNRRMELRRSGVAA